MELRTGQDLDRAIQELCRLKTDLSNAVSGAYQSGAAVNTYLLVVEAAEPLLNNLFEDSEWRARLLTDRYWRIRDADAATPRLAPLIRSEAEFQIAWLDECIKEFETMAREDETADLTSCRAVLDTNFHLHCKPFTDIDWPRELGYPAVRLVVPLVVLKELDNHKNKGGKRGDRAAARLKAMHAVLDAKGKGDVPGRTDVTLEVLLTPNRHVPHPNNDEEIVERSIVFARRRGGPLALITGDYSMKMLAEARGLSVIQLGENLRLPLAPT